MTSNNVTRLLQSRKIAFTGYDLPVEKISALETAAMLQIPPQQVFKTIVVVREKPGKPILAIIPGPNEVDLKALAALLGEKKLKIPTLRETEELTGLQVGGISPLALINRGFQMVLDDSAMLLDVINISGGQRGLNIQIDPKDLVRLVNCRTANISRPDTGLDS